MVQSTWDETIVPALRKRLESESRILAKRMSIPSVYSPDEPPQTPRHIPEPRKSSAIPRPSLQHSRSPTEHPPNGASQSPSLPQKRARTYSQPPSPNGFANNPLPTPDSSRPTSPRTSDVKPTRIPIAARTRTTSGSSNARNHRPYLPTPDTTQDHWLNKQSDPPHPSTPPMVSLRHQTSNIINEPPPFSAPSMTSSIRSRTQEPLRLDPRPSNDSEERPFEHWYRGDVHRNGGVGELRVAKHVEMLQIANYGHNLRKAIRAQTRDLSTQLNAVPGRKRADSVDVGTHDSLYLDDDDDRTKDLGMVLDESPLTDIEADPDTDPETFYDAYTTADAHDAVFTPPLAPLSPSRSQTPTNAHPVPGDDNTPKYATYPLRSGTPSGPPRMSAESAAPAPPASRPRAQTGPRATSPISQSSDQSHTKRRAKSPVASSPASTPKRARTKAKTPPPTSRREDPRNSVATYPTPEGDVVDAIPTWTQPVQKSGNWDEVVLPVVARKKGLDSQYEHVDGSPKPRSPEAPVKPAPGTFGYDYTKYRPPRHGDVQEIQMHEFGLPEPALLPEESVVPPRVERTPKPILIPSQPRKSEELIRQDPRLTVSRPPESPAPFAHYRIDHQVPTINITRPSLDTVEQRQAQEDEDVGAGCCKCVIM